MFTATLMNGAMPTVSAARTMCSQLSVPEGPCSAIYKDKVKTDVPIISTTAGAKKVQKNAVGPCRR